MCCVCGVCVVGVVCVVCDVMKYRATYLLSDTIHVLCDMHGVRYVYDMTCAFTDDMIQ